ncbi:MmyB family transcriptional regulator [Micromonospora violae]|uniref:MmyB family transcriptional regulator n=1 Tax=Micromonospora violae TaxID=1278207 RepID=UPI0033F9824F
MWRMPAASTPPTGTRTKHRSSRSAFRCCRPEPGGTTPESGLEQGRGPVFLVAWNLITWNPLWAALFGDPPPSRGFGRNAVWWSFVAPPAGYPQAVSRDTGHRAAFVSDLRAASARYPKDAGLAALVDELRTRSADFAALWDSGVVGVHESLTKTVRHASVGELTLDCDILAALGTDLRILAFSAAEGSETAERLRLLDVIGVQALTGAGTDR